MLRCRERQSTLDLFLRCGVSRAGPGQPVQGPIPTPIWTSGKVYTIGKTDLLCLDATRGNVLWKKLSTRNTRHRVIDICVAARRRQSADHLRRPIQYLCHAPRIAIDKDSGQTAWRAVTDYAAMSSPTVISAAGKRQLIVWSQQAVTSLDVATGEVCWREATRPAEPEFGGFHATREGKCCLSEG